MPVTSWFSATGSMAFITSRLDLLPSLSTPAVFFSFFSTTVSPSGSPSTDYQDFPFCIARECMSFLCTHSSYNSCCC